MCVCVCVCVRERERERDSIFFISVCFAIWNVCIIKKEIRLGGLLWSIPNVGCSNLCTRGWKMAKIINLPRMLPHLCKMLNITNINKFGYYLQTE